MRLLAPALALVLVGATDVRAQDVLTPELLWSLPRVGAPSVSPDGRMIAFGVTRYDVEANKGNADLYLIPVAGGEPVLLAGTEHRESAATWRPDGEWVGFLSNESESTQLWEIRPDGSGKRQVTDVEGGISNFLYSPDGRHVSFTRNVKVGRTTADLHPDLPEADVRIIDDLMYRHWDHWRDGEYRHLFIATYSDGKIGKPVDLMAGEPYDTPLDPFGGVEQIAWNADGSWIAYTSKKLTGAEFARSTNSEVYVYNLETKETSNFTIGMMGYDIEPAFSPDGRQLAWLSMERDGYEADRNRLFVVDLETAEKRELSEGFDQDAHGPAWSADSRTIYFTSETEGTIQLFAADVESSQIRQVSEGVHNYYGFAVAEGDGGPSLIGQRVSMSAPAELYRVDPRSGATQRLTFLTAPIMDRLELGRVEARWIPATDGGRILTWVIYPPGFDPGQRYPALLYAQGGPQSTVSQFFSYRWNFQLMAANGYIIVAPNRRGVPSFGQAWKEEISRDWGGQAMRDLLSAIDEVATEPFVDPDRLGAVGASFGGYTIFWLAGNHERRFKAFVAHAGVFNLESMFGATEELFFPEFDLGGPYWDSPRPESYDLFSPHRFVQNWDTPMLIIAGQLDFRVPVTEGMQAFTALRAQGIEGRFLYYPEEGHWILSPQNGLVWHREFFGWLDRYLKPPSS
ncbi:MAG: S9 family peptidase [Gemmatimonadales bacterium]